MLLATILMTATVVWSLSRGLNLDSEGAALLLCQNPNLYPLHTQFGFLIGKIPPLLPSPVCNLRMLHLLANLFSSVVLSWGVYIWLTASIDLAVPPRLLVTALMAFATIGGLIRFCLGWSVISYHDLSACLLYCAGGLALAMLSDERLYRTGRALRYFLAPIVIGILNGFILFCYCPTTLIVLPTFTFFSWIAFKRERATVLVCHFAGFLLAVFLCLHFIVGESFAQWWSILTDNIRLEADTSHTLKHLIARYWQSLLLLGRCCWPLSLLFAILAATDLKGKSLTKPTRSILIVLSGSALVWITAQRISIDWHLILLIPFVALVGVFTIPFLVGLSRFRIGLGERADLSRLSTGMILLAVLPIAIVLGTNNLLFSLVVWYWAPWYLLLMVAFLLISKATNSWTLSLPTLIAVCLSSSAAFLIGTVYLPLGMYGPQTERTVATHLPALSGLLFSLDESRYFNRIYDSLKAAGFKQGDPILALYGISGLVYAVSGTAAGSVTFSAKEHEQNAAYISRMGNHQWPCLFMITNRRPLPECSASLASLGINFPADFLKLLSVKDVYTNKEGTLEVYKLRADHPFLRQDLPLQP